MLNCLTLEHPCCIQCFNMTPWEILVMLNRGHLTLYRRLPNRWISRACPVIWPPRSPNLSPWVYSVEAILKTKISFSFFSTFCYQLWLYKYYFVDIYVTFLDDLIFSSLFCNQQNKNYITFKFYFWSILYTFFLFFFLLLVLDFAPGGIA